MPRTTLRLGPAVKGSEKNIKRIWMPLHLENLDHPQNVLDRQSVLDLIRSVYDPLLINWLAEPGRTWVNQFSGRSSGTQFQAQILARVGELPLGVQSIETRKVLGGILYDILRFYRITDPDWRVPAPGSAGPPPPPPPPPPPAAASVPIPASATAPIEEGAGDVLSAAIAMGVVTAAANLEVLTDAANQVLGPTAPAHRPTPLEILAEVASSAEPSPIVSPTSSLDILAAAAGTLPYAPVPAPPAAPAPIDSPTPGVKRGRDDESEDESEQHAKKKQAVSPK
ncbi:hypothetical protein PEXP_081810 [Penicillium expansum]|nr:hypothetical protein PEXP_081810 [Penicillium expansum]